MPDGSSDNSGEGEGSPGEASNDSGAPSETSGPVGTAAQESDPGLPDETTEAVQPSAPETVSDAGTVADASISDGG